jgi:hypothetical protein
VEQRFGQLDLQRGTWLHDCVRFQMSPRHEVREYASALDNTGTVLDGRDIVTVTQEQEEVEEHVASPHGAFLEAYFRRVADTLHHLQTNVSRDCVSIQKFEQVSTVTKEIEICYICHIKAVFLSGSALELRVRLRKTKCSN